MKSLKNVVGSGGGRFVRQKKKYYLRSNTSEEVLRSKAGTISQFVVLDYVENMRVISIKC